MTKEAAEIEAILARLREEVAHTGEESAASVLPSRGARADVERLWSVTAEPHLERGRGPFGWAKRLVKTLLYRAMRWYVEPFAAMQREFNLTLLRLVDELGEQAGIGLLPEVEERLTRIERRLRELAGAPASPAPAIAAPTAAPSPSPMPDYFAFESRMRGSTALVRERQAIYVDDFRDAAPVLDIGCGRGEFLKLLGDVGVEARGIDLDADMVAYCHGEGLDVEQAEALGYLESLNDGELGGVFCAHVVEHLELPSLVRLFELVATKLRAGGLFVAETPNPLTLVALSTFFADLTHVRPLHPETVSLLARQLGFASTEIRYLNRPEGGVGLRHVPGLEALPGAREALDENFERLNEVVFGPQDFAIVARR